MMGNCISKQTFSTNMELTDRYEKSEEKVMELQEDLDAGCTECLLEKQTSAKFEDSLAASCLQRQQDMKELWRLVQSDVDIDHTSTDSQEVVTMPSTELLRDQVAKEMKSLRLKLAKSQMAITSLESRPLPLGIRYSASSDQSNDYRNNNGGHLNSPLIEALTLDMDHLMRNRNADRWQHQHNTPGWQHESTRWQHESTRLQHESTRWQHGSTDDIVDDVALSETDSFWEEQPELLTPCLLCKASRLVNSATQTEDNRRPSISDSRYAAVNTSTGSSTSGIDVSSCSMRSELSSGCHGTYITDTPRTPDSLSSTDDEQPCMQRSPSFRLAIERSQETAVLDLYDGDCTVTSPDLTPVSGAGHVYPGSDNVDPCSECGCRAQSCDCEMVATRCESCTNPEVNRCDDCGVENDIEEEPDIVQNRLRKLSTLVEEGSEIDTEEPIGVCRKMQCSPVTLPPYKSPPAYEPIGSPMDNTSRQTMPAGRNTHNDEPDAESLHPLNQSDKEVEYIEQKMDMKDITQTDTQHTAPGIIADGRNAECPPSSPASRDSSSTQLGQKVEETGKSENQQTDTVQKMTLKRTAKIGQEGLKGTQPHENGREEKSPTEIASTLKTSHSCTSLERLSEMASKDENSTVSMATGQKDKKVADTTSRLISSNDQLSPSQLEDKFCELALRFKANKVKLEERAEQHRHTRDATEENISRELAGLNDELKSMKSSDKEVHALCARLRQHVSVLGHASKQLSSRSEEHGAVQQELRENSAVDVMIQYVENLKREYENLKLTSSIATPQSAGARQKVKGLNLARRATMQTIDPATYQEKFSVTGKLLRRAVSCFPSMSTKHLSKDTGKDQTRVSSGDVGSSDNSVDKMKSGVITTRLAPVEELVSQETQEGSGSVGDTTISQDINQNRTNSLIRRKVVMRVVDSNDQPAATKEPESLDDNCVTSSQDANMTGWHLLSWCWHGTLLQKLRYTFSCLIFACAVVTFAFVFVPTGKRSKMESGAQAVEVTDILKPYTSLRHHAAPPV